MWRSSSLAALVLSLLCVKVAGAWPDALPDFPIEIDQTRAGLVDQAGVPFLVVGDSPWSLMVQLTDAEVATYLADRRARGFNTLLVEIIESGSWGGPANTDGAEPFSPIGDFTQPVEAYWARVDSILDQTAAHGFLVLLTPMYVGWGCGNEGWANYLRQSSAAVIDTYAEFLAARYGHRENILWVHAGDVDPAQCGLDDEVGALASRMKSLDAGSLHTAHCDRTQNSFDCADQFWLDVDSVYSHCQGAALDVRDAYRLPVSTPHYFIEGYYENERASDTCLMSQLYWPMLGGLQGSVYGNDPLWWFGPGWQAALADDGARYVEMSARLMKSRPWADFVPDYDHVHVTSGYGSINDESYVGVAVTRDARTLIAYTPANTTLTVDLTRLAGTNVRAWRFDPSSGNSVDLGTFATSAPRSFPLTGPTILVLDDASAGFAAPGTSVYYTPEPYAAPGAIAGLGLLAALSRRRQSASRGTPRCDDVARSTSTSRRSPSRIAPTSESANRAA